FPAQSSPRCSAGKGSWWRGARADPCRATRDPATPGRLRTAGRSVNDHGMSDFEWSDDVAQAAWIGDRLSPFDAAVATSVVPTGFEAYARILHPAFDASAERFVRW